MTINEKYEILKAEGGRNTIIFKDVGIPNGQGGWLREPRMDPDHDYQIPTLRAFAVVGNETQRRQRVHDICNQGWAVFEPEPAPETVKRKTRTRKSSSTKSTSK